MFCVISVSSARQSLTTYNFEHRLFDESRAAFASSLTWARRVSRSGVCDTALRSGVWKGPSVLY